MNLPNNANFGLNYNINNVKNNNKRIRIIKYKKKINNVKYNILK